MRNVGRSVLGILVAAASLAVPVAGSQAAGPQHLFRSPVYGVPGDDNVIVSGDFNGDGKPDVAVANTETHDLSVFLGDGRGGLVLQPTPDLPDGYLAAADLDRDGLDDLVVANAAGNELVVALSRGDGTFGPPLHLSAGSYPQGVVAADLDGDGIPDLAVANYASGDVSVFVGRGDGTFEPPARFPAGHDPIQIAAGPIDGDGRVDLAVASYDPGGITILLGNGDGTFTQGTPIADGVSHRSIVAADLDGDGRDELVTANLYDASVYTNRGDGTFGPPATYAPREDLVFQAIVADVTGDGTPDLLLTANGGTVFPGNGDGTFGARRTMGGAAFSYQMAVADFDGDGIADLATANGYNQTVSVLHGNGDGTSGSHLVPGAFPLRIRGRDLNGDGRTDLIVLDEDSADVTVFLARSDGGFGAGTRYPVPYFYFPVLLADGDFDGDGRVDLAIGTYGVPVLVVMRGRGDGSFGSPTLIPFAPIISLVAGDVDGDGRADLAGARGNGYVETRLSLGDGSFGKPIDTETDAYGDLALADLNGDGILDLAQDDEIYNDAVALLGNGDGSFRSVWRGGDSSVYDLAGITIGDVDGNGVQDLILTGQDGFAVSLGAGDGTFGPATTYFGAERDYAPWAAVADFDLDGRPDVILPYSVDDIGVFVGTGGGALALQGRYDGGSGPFEAVVGDFDHDGRPDLALADAESNLVSVLYNRADRPPIARAGPDQVLECQGFLHATARLDGSASTDPDSTPGTDDDIASYVWSEGGTPFAQSATTDASLLLGTHALTLTVTDTAGRAASDGTAISVVDTHPPTGTILAPAPDACFGPSGLPVTVADDFTDVCDPAIVRTYDPAPGPSYDGHGDHHVTVTAADASGNAAAGSVDFTIDTKAPSVTLLAPAAGGILTPGSLPFRVVFTDSDDDGAAGGVVHEVVKLDGCTIFDGSTYGNRDGLLSDESLVLDGTQICRIAAACGFTTLDNPEIRVEATDCGGNVGADAHRLGGSLTLRPGICGN